MPLSAGDRVGVYEISSLLGAGGMGEVYRARDHRLGRDLAIKVLPAMFARDAQYMARFEREAQLLASLNHPNIATIYGVEQDALVMELVEGETLADRIAAGALPIEEALPIARQIAEGLEAAHERGVVHRDLKPANVKITPAGVVKLLDFGLAKAADEGAASASQLAISPTLSLAMTQAGMILGTAAYMSPEQARGKQVDRRTDIWAFGVVLYEMLTGRVLFAGGDTVTDIIAAVVTREPEWSALPDSTPAHIRRLLERCLRKDVKTRLQWIGEARIAIDEPAATVGAVPARQPASRSLLWLASGVAAVAIVAAAAGWWRATRPSAPRPLIRMNVEMTSDSPLSTSAGGMMAISPDGARFVVALRGPDGKLRLHTRLLHQSQLTALAGTENAGTPFFSPNGQWIGFGADGKLKKISVEGGAPVTLCDAPNLRGASWGDDGSIVAALSVTGGLSRVSSDGGTPAEVTKLTPGERTHRWPQVVPGSEAVVFTAHTGAVDYNEASIEVVSLNTGQRKVLRRGGFFGRYVGLPGGSGHLMYIHQDTVFATPFDLNLQAATGTAVPVIEDVSFGTGAGAPYVFSSTGTFIYVAGRSQRGRTSVLSWIDNSGKTQPLHGLPGIYYTPRLSADGKRLAFATARGRGFDVWVKDLDRDTASRLSFLEGVNSAPLWTPDGKNIVFKSESATGPGLYWIRSDGAGEVHRLSDGKLQETPTSISSDGKRLAFTQTGNAGSPDVYTAAILTEPGLPKLGQPELFVGTPFAEVQAAFSPDGRWVAYMSVESGTGEIYVRPFPGPGGRWQISSGGGTFPAWSRGGRELLFKGADQRLMSVSYTAVGDSFIPGKPRPWASTPMVTAGFYPTWDLSADGKRVAAVLMHDTDGEQKPTTHLTFLLNFFDELQRRTTVEGR
jgi:Tol biopolymer transport system component/predicted Ser/Thr protein kinase